MVVFVATEGLKMRALIVALLLAHGAAMGQTFACQYTAAGGLNWENGRWVTRGFRLGAPFFLKVERGSLTEDSVSKILLGSPETVTCRVIVDHPPFKERVRYACFNHFGSFIHFSPSDTRGSIAQTFGSVSSGLDTGSSTPDSLAISSFTCQQM